MLFCILVGGVVIDDGDGGGGGGGGVIYLWLYCISDISIFLSSLSLSLSIYLSIYLSQLLIITTKITIFAKVLSLDKSCFLFLLYLFS